MKAIFLMIAIVFCYSCGISKPDDTDVDGTEDAVSAGPCKRCDPPVPPLADPGSHDLNVPPARANRSVQDLSSKGVIALIADVHSGVVTPQTVCAPWPCAGNTFICTILCDPNFGECVTWGPEDGTGHCEYLRATF